jgi:AcrR family transcriptional regulator
MVSSCNTDVVRTQAERRSQTRAALLTAARNRFGLVGFERVTIDELAESAGVTRGALYHHFTSKEDLFEKVFELVQQELLDHIVKAANAGRADSLRVGARAYISLASRADFAQIALIDAPAVLGPSRYRSIDQAYFLPLVAQAIHHGKPPRVDPLSNAVLAAICELALQAHLHPKSKGVILRALDHLLETMPVAER